jgi:hypothetical protein
MPAVHFLTSQQLEHHPKALNSVVRNISVPAIACFLRLEERNVADYKKDVSVLFAE